MNIDMNTSNLSTINLTEDSILETDSNMKISIEGSMAITSSTEFQMNDEFSIIDENVSDDAEEDHEKSASNIDQIFAISQEEADVHNSSTNEDIVRELF